MRVLVVEDAKPMADALARGLREKGYAVDIAMIHAGEVLSRESISEHVWDENFDPFSNLIEVYIRRLRKKIDCGRMQKLIYTRRGVGYMLSAEVIEEPDSWNQAWD